MEKAMKSELELEGDHNLEIIKAAAQAWYGHSGNSRPANECDAYRRSFKQRPTRFKLEVLNLDKPSSRRDVPTTKWDFGQSLWDSYEIVAVSKRLEEGLVLDHPLSGIDDFAQLPKRRKESKNSLRRLFNKISSRRFNDADMPQEGVTLF